MNQLIVYTVGYTLLTNELNQLYTLLIVYTVVYTVYSKCYYTSCIHCSLNDLEPTYYTGSPNEDPLFHSLAKPSLQATVDKPALNFKAAKRIKRKFNKVEQIFRTRA